MASSALAGQQQVCLMCLGSPAVRKVGTCQHAYCISCIMSHIKNQFQVMGQEEDVIFACPACRTQGLLSDKTEDQQTNVLDPSTTAVGGGNGASESGCRKIKSMRPERWAAFKEANCRLCLYKGTEVPIKAENICKECNELPMCESCTNHHRKNRATEGHVVVSLGLFLKKGDECCKIHGDPIAGRCVDCSLAVCPVCVSLDHADHHIRTMNDFIQSGIEKVKAAKDWEVNRLQMLHADMEDLEEMTAIVEGMESAVLKNIEDHAEMCIAQILKNKEDAKKWVLADFQLVTTLKKQLDAMPKLLKASEELTARANFLLVKQVELSHSFSEKLSALESEFSKLNARHPYYEKAKKAYMKEYADLRQRDTQFFPRQPNLKIGGFEDIYSEPKCYEGGYCVCEMCEKKFKIPNIWRKDECKRRGWCQCGTCANTYRA